MEKELAKYVSELIRNVNVLEYESEAGWRLCPEWVAYLIKMGVVLGSQTKRSEPFFVIISVPERSFAAVFLGMGIVIARALVPGHESESRARVEQLLVLGEGTAVILRNPDRKLKGTFVRLAKTSTGKWLCIKVERGTELYVPVHDAYRIEIADTQKLKLPKRQTGIHYREKSGLLEGLIPRDVQNDFQLRTSLEAVFVGPKNRLLDEMKSTQFNASGVTKRSTHQPGYLADLLRPMSLVSRGSAYRTRVVPSGNATIGAVLAENKPFSFVFDGALALVKWRGFCRHENQIAILDRTEAQYEVGIEAVNNLYIEIRTQDRVDFELPEPPVGIIVSAFPVLGGAS